MSMIPKIKICGIKDPILAYQTALMGVENIGLIFASTSKRVVDLQQACEIANAAREGGAEPVAIFTDQDATAMQNICAKTGINIVQLHGDIAREQQQYLSDTIQRIYVLHVDGEGIIVNSAGSYTTQLSPERDYLLFDGLQGGSGQRIKLDNVKSFVTDFNYFIAGGLNVDNIRSVIKETSPYGVDVSSGVENTQGEKSKELIQAFVNTVHDDEYS